jgi:dolichol-phosphate mannosyltransferase
VFEKIKGPVLVTGAGGFIGRNLMNSIVAERKDVLGTIRTPLKGLSPAIPEENLTYGDLNDSAFLKFLIDEFRPSTIIHAASYGNSSRHTDIAKIYDTNLISSSLLAEEARRIGVGTFINLGTSSEYGWNSSAPAEDAHCFPNSHYAIAKRAFTDVLLKMSKETGFPAVTLRLYSVYGPYEDPQRLVPSALLAAANGKLLRFARADISRDFVFIDDVVEAIALACEKAGQPNVRRVLNIGSGNKTTLQDFAKVVKEEFGIMTTPEFGTYAPRPWDLTDWVSDPSLSAQELGWAAKTSLPTGLRMTAEWQMSHSEFTEEKTRVAHQPAESLVNLTLPTVSAIVACYRDEMAIDEMYARLTAVFHQIGCGYEIIFVNDSSPDSCEEKIRRISERDERVTGITHSRNFGSQMAFLSGMELARMESVVLLDGDLQDPPEVIADFYDQWVSGFDVVYGVRSRREMRWFEEAPYRAFYRVNRWLSGGRIPLDAGDFSLIDRKVVDWILRTPEKDFLLRGIRAFLGFKQTGVDYFRPKRKHGSSTNSFFSNLGWAKKSFFSFSDKPLSIITNTGFVMLFLGFAASLFTLFWRFLAPEQTPSGVTTILIAILVFGALNLFSLGIIGEYVGKILTEAKNRPRFIRHRIIRSGTATPFQQAI